MQDVPKFVNYQETPEYAEFMQDMREACPIPQTDKGFRVLRYDLSAYSIIDDLLKLLQDRGLFQRDASILDGKLEQLHDIVAPEHLVLDGSQQSNVAKSLYDTNPDILSFFKAILAKVVAPALNLGPLHYQLTPTFRVFAPKVAGYPGRTTYHCDFMLGHTPRELNIVIPFTQCAGTRSLLIADLDSSRNLLDRYDGNYSQFAHDTQYNEELIAECQAICRPIELSAGDVLLFDPRCIHAGPNNITDQTRVTVDLRVLPQRRYAAQKNRYVGTGRRKMEFVPGIYFSEETL